MTHHYRGYGLDIRSDISLPEFLPGRRDVPAEVTIRLEPGAGPAFEPADGAVEDWEFVPAAGGGYLLQVPEVGLFNVAGGREIRLAPRDDADEGLLRLFLLGSAMGMLLHQRGLLVLHGATVLNPGGTATLFVGDSGAGKSTLAAAFGRAGHAILGDDTMPVHTTPRGFAVWPGSRVFKLWDDTLRHLGEPIEPLEKIQTRTDKFFWPNRAHAPDAPALLTEIVHLVGAGEGAGPSFEELDGLAALRLVAENTYRPHYIALLGRATEHFHQCAALAATLRVGRLARPRDLTRLEEGVGLIRRRWAREAAAAAAP